MTLRDVHVRYEDSVSNPAAPFACGVMVQSFAFHTTDAEGRDVFLDRTATNQQKATAFVHKAVAVTQLGVYWDRLGGPHQPPLQHAPDIEQQMAAMVRDMATPATPSSRDRHEWLLRPCSVAVQLTKNESQDYARVAKFTAQATLQGVALGLARSQYEDMWFVHQAFDGRRAIETHFRYGRCRPFHSACERPREWWDYATRLVLAAQRAARATSDTVAVGKRTSQRLRWSTVARAGAERRAYVTAFRAHLHKRNAQTTVLAEGLDAFEMTYPVDVVMAVRDAAEDKEEEEAAEREKKRREHSAATTGSHAGATGGATGGSWYDYFFSGAKTTATATLSSPSSELSSSMSSTDEFADMLTAQGRADLKQAYDDVATKAETPSVPPGCNLVSVKLQLKGGSLALFQAGQRTPFFVASADGSLALNVQPSDEWDARFRLQRFEVVNASAAADSAFRTFCSLSSAAKVVNPKLPCVSFDASLRNDSDSASRTQSTLKLRVSAVPIRVMVDPSFVLRVQDFFASLLPEQQLDRVWSFATSSVADWIFSDQEDELLATTLQSTRPTMRYDVAIDMRAPVFVVPEDVNDAHASVVVVDLGQFSFTSDPGHEQPVAHSDATPATLCWRLDITKVQLLLGRLHDVDWVADADFQRFATLVEQLNLAFGVETLTPTLTIRPSKESAAAALTHPTTSVHATIPQIAVSLAEGQLIALARIHSSILAQMTLAGRHRRQQLVLETTATASPATALSHAPSEAASASTTASADKYHLHVQVSLGEIVLNLRESATRDAFRLRVTQTSFDAAVFASQYVLHARLQSLLMEDMLYDPSSCFRQLMATGATTDATTHLVAIDVTMYPPSHGVVDREREATFMVVDMKVNVLDIQWNPSSMSLLYRLTTSYVVALQHHRIDSDAFDASGPLVANEATTVGQTSGGTAPVEPLHVAVTPVPASNATVSQVPSILARASLVQFSVTFNKDDMNRQLVQLAMKDASVEYSSSHDASYAWRGHVGNFIATDLSMAKHPVYSPLVGLDESSSLSSLSSSSAATALLAFSYAFDPSTSEKSVLSLQFQPVRMVYYHQQVLELSDYLFEGILGTMVSHTLFNATQLLLSQTEASVVLQVAFEKPTVLLPVRMADPNHVRITAELLSLRHFPTSAVHYVGTNDALATRRRVVAPGEALASSVVCRSDCTSFRLDYKQISLKRVNIIYVSEAPVSSTSSVAYESLVARPMDLVVDVEDLTSADVRVGDGPFLPRFSIRVAMAELELLLQRRHYVQFVGVLTENFGAEQLQVASRSLADTHDVDSSATGRPNVSYSYSRTDLEAVTMELGFSMKRLQCVLYEDDSSVHSSGDPDHVARAALSGVGRPDASAMSEILASDFSVSLNFLRDADPSVTVGVASFVVRALDDRTTGETTGDRRNSEPLVVSSESPGVLLVCTHPTQASYSWDPTQLTCALELNLSKATGVLIPEATAGLADFFAVPTASELPTTRSSPPVLSRSESSGGSQRVTRRHSITELGRDARGVAYAMTVRLSATQLAVDVPQDLESVDSPRLSLRADLSAEYTWKPASADAQDAAAAAADFDIQSSLVVDARAIEVVVKNANRQGCYASHPSDSDSAGTQRVAVATLVQLLEPCDLHVEVSDLFPHAGQKQQIVAFRFTPIELFVSYDDMCLGVATLRTMSDSVARYERKQSQQRGDAATLVGTPPPAAGVLSPKTFAAPSVGGANLELHRYFTCEASSMRLTVINDCDGCDMGLLQMHMQRCNAFLNVTYAPTPVANASFPPPSTVISGGGGFVMMMSYYNPDTRTWHQMCREWGLDISLQGSIFTSDTPTTLSSDALSSRASDNELHIIVTANQPLDLLVTHGLLEVVASAGGAWNRRASGASSPVADTTKHAPCVISNDTGLSVRFWLTNGHATTAAEVVWTGEMADLHYMHTVGRGSGVVRKYASSDRADNMRLCVALEDASFQPVQGIIFEQLGSRAFPLVDVSGSLSPFTLNCHAKLVDGRILLSLSSQMKVVNNLSMPVQLLVNDPTWRSPVDIGVLYPCRESAIPVLLSLGSELRVRPVDDAFAWSAPIPVQTRSAVAQQVEAAGATGVGVPSAIFCVSMTIEQSLRVVCLSEPIVIVNKLPVALEYRVKSPLRQHAPASTATTLSVGAKSGVWWSDSAQRPLFQLTVDGCKPSKWLELVHPGTKSGAVVSVLLERRDGRAFKLLVHVVEAAARSMHVFLYAEVWFVNRTGLDLVYGNETDTEAYAPPLAARALVGNAQICAFSSGTDAGSGPPVVRVRMRATRWSARFTADPRKLSWQDECLSLRSEPRTSADSVGSGMLYELGVSADYATRHFGALTTLVSVIPRYLVRNHTPYTVLLLESSVRSSVGGNAAHHVLASGDVYALYWVTGARSQVHVSVVGAPSDYGWSSAVGVDDVAARDVVLPAAAQSAQPLTLQVAVKRGSLSQATFVVEISDTPTGSGSAGSPAASPMSQATATALAASAHAGWDTFSVHTQIAGVIVTVADKNESAENDSVPTVSGETTNEHVARLTISRISLESNVSRHGTSAKMNVMGVKVEDLLAHSKNPVVLRPVFRTSATTTTTSSSSGAGKYFLEVAYVEKPHAKYLYVESLRVELQDVKITTSMRFVDRLHALANETVSHFQRRSLAAASQAATSLLEAQESDASEQLLAYFAASDDDTSLASLTGRKVYIASCTVEPVRVVVSFSRDKHDARRQRQAAASALGGGGLPSQSFWLAHLKLEIENACLTLGAYRLTHALATQEALVASLAGFYVASVKSQALGLLESVQVTSLVTSMVAGGVSSLVNTLVGKTDPSLTTRQHHFQYAFLTNAQIVAKHAQLLSQCRSSTDFVTQLRHLVYDWDSNHTGLEARGCVALGIVNNSRHALVVNTRLNDGADLRVLPIGRRTLAGVATDDTMAFGRNEWRPDRALVVFAYGYTPTLLTSGDVYFTVQSNACNVFATRKTARVVANVGYTATFTHQETQTWWASHVVIVGDDIQARAPAARLSIDSIRADSMADSAGYDLFGGDSEAATQNDDDEYEVVFTSASLGLIAKQSGRAVIVRELCALPSGGPGPALATGEIAPGDSILSVSGMRVTNTTQFAQLVGQSPRPVVLRFRRTSEQAAYNLFGETAASRSSRSREVSGAGSNSSDSDDFNLFGK